MKNLAWAVLTVLTFSACGKGELYPPTEGIVDPTVGKTQPSTPQEFKKEIKEQLSSVLLPKDGEPVSGDGRVFDDEDIDTIFENIEKNGSDIAHVYEKMNELLPEGAELTAAELESSRIRLIDYSEHPEYHDLREFFRDYRFDVMSQGVSYSSDEQLWMGDFDTDLRDFDLYSPEFNENALKKLRELFHRGAYSKWSEVDSLINEFDEAFEPLVKAERERLELD